MPNELQKIGYDTSRANAEAGEIREPVLNTGGGTYSKIELIAKDPDDSTFWHWPSVERLLTGSGSPTPTDAEAITAGCELIGVDDNTFSKITGSTTLRVTLKSIDTALNNIAAINDVLLKDGSVNPTGNFDWDGNNISNVAAFTVSDGGTIGSATTPGAVTVASDGSIGINNDTPGNRLEVSESGSASKIEISTWSTTDTNMSSIIFQKSNNNTINTLTATAAGEYLGSILSSGVDTGGTNRNAAQIWFLGDAAPDAAAVPGKILFRTSNASSLQSALLIDDDQLATFYANLSLASDGAVMSFGAGSDVSLTHVHNTGLLLNGTSQLQFGDALAYIYNDGVDLIIRTDEDDIEILAFQDLRLNPQSGSIINENAMFIKEVGAARTNRAGYFQMWVKNDAPNYLEMRDDADSLVAIFKSSVVEINGDLTMNAGKTLSLGDITLSIIDGGLSPDDINITMGGCVSTWTFENSLNNDLMIISDSGNEIVKIINPITTNSLPILHLDQADVDEPFIKFTGDAAAATLTNDLVDAGDVGTFTTTGYLKIEVLDDGNQITDGDYYIPFGTITPPP